MFASGIDDRQRVLDATDIVRLVGEHLSLRPKGREFVGLCPFHDDHTPSMSVVPSKQIYYCFACGAGGNALAFVMNYHRMPFGEALRFLADKAGITLTPRRPGQPESAAAPGDRAALIAAHQTAHSFFRAILAHAEHGRLARDMLQRRGLAPETVEQFQIGASPDKWDGLATTLAARHTPLTPFLDAGLLKPRDSGGCYDAFRNRLIFPIQDQIGRIIAFGARRLKDDDDPKYLNSPESPIFNKSSTLFALNHASQAIRASGVAIVTEGYMDAIACHEAGLTNVVATLGTALTAANARILKRLADAVVLLFDGDAAGRKAAERAVEVFFAEPVDLKIAVLSAHTDAKDPDELLKRPDGRAMLEHIIAHAADPFTLLFDGVRSDAEGRGLTGRTRLVEEFIARLNDLGIGRLDPMRYQLVVKRLAQIAGVDWDVMAALLASRKKKIVPGAGAASDLHTATLSLHEQLLGCILCDPVLVHSVHADERDLLIPADADGQPSPARSLARTMLAMAEGGEEPSLNALFATSDDADLHRVAAACAATVDRITDGSGDRVHALWRDSLHRLRLDDAQRRSTTMVAADSWARLSSLRAAHQAVGGDPRRLPRPGG